MSAMIEIQKPAETDTYALRRAVGRPSGMLQSPIGASTGLTRVMKTTAVRSR